MLDRGIGILGIALALIFGVWSLAPEGWPKMPVWAIQSGLAVGLLLIGLAAGLIIADKRNPQGQLFADTAELQLHIYGDERTPNRLSFSNIWRWYFMQTAFVSMNEKGVEVGRKTVQTLFITFDTPVKIGTLEVSSPDARLPINEVKDFNPRSAVIVFSENVPPCTLIIKVHQ